MPYNIQSNCAHLFCAELYRGCSTGYANICIFWPDDQKYGLSITLDEVRSPEFTEPLTETTDANVYLQVTPISTALQWPRRGKLQDVISVPTFFADIDFKHPKKKETALPADEAEAMRLFEPGGFLAPTMIVKTGHGLHGYWLLEEPVEIVDEAKRLDMRDRARAFGAALNAHALDKHGWVFDPVFDLPRLGRLPGTLNVKHDPPASVTWWKSAQSRRYTLAEIDTEVRRHVSAVPKSARPARSSSAAKATSQQSFPNLSLAEELRNADAKWWLAKQLEEPVGENPAAIMAGCAFLQHAAEDAATLSEPEWFDALRLLAEAENGEIIAHAMSKPYPEYDETKLTAKFAHAKTYEGRLTCDHIAVAHPDGGCASCPLRPKLHSPVNLGDRSAHHVGLLVSTAYVERTDEFYDLERVAKDGVAAHQFSRFHGGKRFFDSPSKAITADPLAIKAHERAYRPDRAPGVFVEDATSFLNTYAPPVHALMSGRPDLFYDHIDFLVPDPAERNVVINWFAHLVQRPGAKLGYSVALIGGQGTGKSYMLDVMTQVLGADNVRVSGGGSVNSDFNGHLAGKVLLGLEEVSIKGRAESYEGLKALITNEKAEFQRKRIDRETLQTPRGVLVLSNDPYALHLPADDRRFFVVQTPAQKHPDGPAYYKRLFAFDAEFVAQVYHSLMQVDLSGFDWKNPPFETTAKTRMIGYSRADVDVMIQELVDGYQGPFAYALATWDDLRLFVRDRIADRSLTDKRIRRALELTGVVSDPRNRQCRLNGGGRPKMFLIRCIDEVAGLDAKQLAELYEADAPRYDKLPDDDAVDEKPLKRNHLAQPFVRRVANER